ncbi:MAG: phosphoserine phosphatase SerB, partial [Pseudomonadota bacterium]
AQPVASRAKKLLISDMDSTLIEQECIDELGAMVGKKAEIAAITERAMAGELDFAEALRARVALLRGVPTSAVAELLADVIVDTPGAREVIAACRAAGIRTVLVSGGFTAFAEPIRQRLGMDAAHSNILLTDGDVFSGAVADPILGADAKRERMNAECAALQITASEVVAVGDGANDLAMIDGAGLGIGYRPKPKLAEAANAVLRYTDFSTVGYAIGLLRP